MTKYNWKIYEHERNFPVFTSIEIKYRTLQDIKKKKKKIKNTASLTYTGKTSIHDTAISTTLDLKIFGR